MTLIAWQYSIARVLQLASAFLGAAAFSGALVALTIRICRRRDWVARPRSGRWHRTTPSLFGGVPIWLACLSLSLFLIPHSNRPLWKILAASSVMFLLGLADDIWHLRPRTKLAAQVLAATMVAGSGIVYPLRQHASVNFLVSVLWMVGITNAFNLLDNMDGLCAGVACVSAFYLAIFYASTGAWACSIVALITMGAAAGFLIFNFNPARIFMGDCGSLFLGFLIASLSLLETTHLSGVPTFVLAPVVLLAVPLFDTILVSVTRRLRGQPISEGGTDHSSHRLVHSGLNERWAVSLLITLSVISGAVALASRHMFPGRALILIGFWFSFLSLFGAFLFRRETMSASTLPHSAPRQPAKSSFSRGNRTHQQDSISLPKLRNDPN